MQLILNSLDCPFSKLGFMSERWQLFLCQVIYHRPGLTALFFLSGAGTSSLMVIIVATGTFMYALMHLIQKFVMFVLEKQKTWVLVRSNDFWKCEVILQSSLLSFVKTFDGSSEDVVFQKLVPEVYVQQLPFQAFINQKLLVLKKATSTSFFWYAAK